MRRSAPRGTRRECVSARNSPVGGLPSNEKLARSPVTSTSRQSAPWRSGNASRVLLGLVVEAFVPEGPVVVGIDETLERRYGKKIKAKGVYHDPVRPTHENFVKSSVLCGGYA